MKRIPVWAPICWFAVVAVIGVGSLMWGGQLIRDRAELGRLVSATEKKIAELDKVIGEVAYINVKRSRLFLRGCRCS